MKLFEQITLKVVTEFGAFSARFTVVDSLPNNRFALMSQNKLIVGEKKADGSWVMGKSIDLVKSEIIEEKVWFQAQ